MNRVIPKSFQVKNSNTFKKGKGFIMQTSANLLRLTKN